MTGTVSFRMNRILQRSDEGGLAGVNKYHNMSWLDSACNEMECGNNK